MTEKTIANNRVKDNVLYSNSWGETLKAQRSALRWDIKRGLKGLCNKLADLGEDVFVVTVNVANGWVGHTGTVRGDEYINDRSHILYDFLNYCAESVKTREPDDDEEMSEEDNEEETIVGKSDNPDQPIHLSNTLTLNQDDDDDNDDSQPSQHDLLQNMPFSNKRRKRSSDESKTVKHKANKQTKAEDNSKTVAGKDNSGTQLGEDNSDSQEDNYDTQSGKDNSEAEIREVNFLIPNEDDESETFLRVGEIKNEIEDGIPVIKQEVESETESDNVDLGEPDIDTGPSGMSYKKGMEHEVTVETKCRRNIDIGNGLRLKSPDRTLHGFINIQKRSSLAPSSVNKPGIQGNNLGKIANNKHRKTIDSPFICHFCGKQLQTRSSYRKHVGAHTGEAPYSCCGRGYFDKTRLLMHRCSRHGEKRNKLCQVCGKSFPSDQQLLQHMDVHTQGKFKCEKCDKVFKTNQSLKDHTLVHDGKKTYNCLCGRTFQYASGLSRHRHSCTHKKK